MSCDLSQMQSWWNALRLPTEIINVRIPTEYIKDGKRCSGAKNVHCGSIAEIEAFVRNNSAPQYWATIQELDPSTLDRHAAAADDNMKKFRWAVIEFDPQRKRLGDPADLDVVALRQKRTPKGEGARVRASDPTDFEVPSRGSLAATDAEKELAFAAARKAYVYVKKNSGVSPAIVDSGNGAYVKIPVDIPYTKENAAGFAAAIDGFAGMFKTVGVDIDTTAKNASRVLGIPGTWNRKGPNTTDRPHRMRILKVPGDRKIVLNLEQLTALAKVTASETNNSGPSSKNDEPKLGPFTYQNMEGLLKKLNARNESFTFERGKTKHAPGWWVRCPNESEHTDKAINSSSAVWVATDRGYPNFKCLHEHCAEIEWPEFVKLWEIADLQKEIAGGPTPHFGTGVGMPDDEPEFKKPRVEGGDFDFVVNPLEGAIDGWFPLGELSLVGGSSGAGKTTWVMPMLHEQKEGHNIFGYTTNHLPYLLLLEDRSLSSLRRTAKRIGLDLTNTPYRILNREGKSIAQAVADELDRTDPAPAVVFLEGIDLSVEDAHKMDSVSRNIKALQRVAEHYHVAIIGSTGCPKMKPKDRYVSLRDCIYGSVAWARKVETIVTLQKENGLDTADKVVMTVLPRNAKHEVFELEFAAGGRLIPCKPTESKPEEINADYAMEQWARRQKEPFTRAEFMLAFPLSETHTRRKLDRLVALKVVEKVFGKRGATLYKPLSMNFEF